MDTWVAIVAELKALTAWGPLNWTQPEEVLKAKDFYYLLQVRRQGNSFQGTVSP